MAATTETYYTPPYIEHKGFKYVGSIQTVCKAIDRADDIDGLNEKSKLLLRRERTNKYDQNAIQVVAPEFSHAVNDGKTLAKGGGGGSNASTPVVLTMPSAGYLPARLCEQIAPILDACAARDCKSADDDVHVDATTARTIVDCIMLGKPTSGLSNDCATWFDVQLDFFMDATLHDSDREKLASRLQTIRDGAPSSLT